MFTIKELEDRWNDYESACLITIKQLLADKKEIIFESDDPGIHPICIGDDGYGLIDAIILKIKLENNDIYVTYQDLNCPEFILEEDIRYICHINYLEIIQYIKEKWQD